ARDHRRARPPGPPPEDRRGLQARLMRRAALLALLAAACDPRLYAKEKEPEKEKPAADEPSPPMSPFAALGALGRGNEPGPFAEPRHSKGWSEDKPYAAVLELHGEVVELPLSLSLSHLGGGDSLSLRALTGRLAELDGDAKVTAVVLRLGDLHMSLAAAEELNGAIAAMKKPVRCHAERVDGRTLVLLAACQRVALAPGGALAVAGPALRP